MLLPHLRNTLIALLLAAFAWPWAHADSALQPVPALTARAIDQTGMLSQEQLQALEAQLRALEQKRGSQVAVLMVKTTAPEDIAAYAHRVASEWKIGRREVGDGVLVVVAKDDRRMRIEVARALEGAIPDIAAARIIDEAMAPNFRQGYYAQGLEAALRQLEELIARGLSKSDSAVQSGDGASNWVSKGAAYFFFLGGVLGLVYVAYMVYSMLRSLGRAYTAMTGGARMAGLLMGSAVGVLLALLTPSLLLAAGGAAVAVLLFMGLHGLAFRWGEASAASSASSGESGWGNDSSGSGFRSSGGGDFGGGGASGSW